MIFETILNSNNLSNLENQLIQNCTIRIITYYCKINSFASYTIYSVEQIKLVIFYTILFLRRQNYNIRVVQLYNSNISLKSCTTTKIVQYKEISKKII